MRKVIAAFNMTLDGVCDHTTGIPSEDLHQHLASSGVPKNLPISLPIECVFHLDTKKKRK